MQRFRLTAYFVLTALVVIALAAVVVNRLVGDLARGNLIRIAEENTARDAVHIQAMMRRGHSMRGMPTPNGKAIQDIPQPRPLSLEYLTSPEGLSGSYQMLVEGLSIVKLNLFDLNGTTVWSTDSKTIRHNQARESSIPESRNGKTFL